MKICKRCNLDKNNQEFRSHPRRKDGLSDFCIKCVKDKRSARERVTKDHGAIYRKFEPKIRNRFLQRHYGISLEQYEKILNDQNGLCKICKSPCSSGKRLAVDHCHITGKVRGLLCARCNRGIGHFADDPEILIEALSYLGYNLNDEHRSVLRRQRNDQG